MLFNDKFPIDYVMSVRAVDCDMIYFLTNITIDVLLIILSEYHLI